MSRSGDVLTVGCPLPREGVLEPPAKWARLRHGCPVAHRDENTFDGADEMRLDRSPEPRPTFGTGVHSCPLRAPARTGSQTVLGVPLRRPPTRELTVPADDLRRREGLIVGGPRNVPVR